MEEIIKGRVAAGSEIHRCFVRDCKKVPFIALTRIGSVEKIKIITNFIKRQAVSLEDVFYSEEFKKALDILKDIKANDGHYDAAYELIRCVIAFLIKLKSTTIESQTFEEIFNLRLTVQAAYENNQKEKIKSLCKIFVNLGERFITKIVNGSHYSKSIVNVLLKFTKYQFLAPLTFNFWILLSNSVTSLNQKREFSMIYEKLILNLARALMEKIYLSKSSMDNDENMENLKVSFIKKEPNFNFF